MRKPTWRPYQLGQSIGKKDAEGSTIVRDEEHPLGGRLTIKKGKGFISVSCMIAGRMDHTRFFEKMPEALYAYEQMKPELETILRNLAHASPTDIKAWELISEFVMRFP